MSVQVGSGSAENALRDRQFLSERVAARQHARWIADKEAKRLREQGELAGLVAEIKAEVPYAILRWESAGFDDDGTGRLEEVSVLANSADDVAYKRGFPLGHHELRLTRLVGYRICQLAPYEQLPVYLCPTLNALVAYGDVRDQRGRFAWMPGGDRWLTKPMPIELTDLVATVYESMLFPYQKVQLGEALGALRSLGARS